MSLYDMETQVLNLANCAIFYFQIKILEEYMCTMYHIYFDYQLFYSSLLD